MLNVKKLKQLAKKYAVTFTDRGKGHLQIHGQLLVNYSPESKNQSAYVRGTKIAQKGVTLEQAFIMSITVPNLITNKVKRKNSYRKEKLKLLNKHPFCKWCHTKLSIETATIEHIIPLVIGGLNNFNNYAIACEKCNKTRGCDMPEIKLHSKGHQNDIKKL